MEEAIDKLRTEIESFLSQLKEKRKAYEDSMQRDDVLANAKQILKEIKRLENAIVSVVENFFGGKGQVG